MLRKQDNTDKSGGDDFTDEELAALAKFNELPDGAAELVDGLMQIADAADKSSHSLTVENIRDGLALALTSGKGTACLAVDLVMAVSAIRQLSLLSGYDEERAEVQRVIDNFGFIISGTPVQS